MAQAQRNSGVSFGNAAGHGIGAPPTSAANNIPSSRKMQHPFQVNAWRVFHCSPSCNYQNVLYCVTSMFELTLRFVLILSCHSFLLRPCTHFPRWHLQLIFSSHSLKLNYYNQPIAIWSVDSVCGGIGGDALFRGHPTFFGRLMSLTHTISPQVAVVR